MKNLFLKYIGSIYKRDYLNNFFHLDTKNLRQLFEVVSLNLEDVLKFINIYLKEQT